MYKVKILFSELLKKGVKNVYKYLYKDFILFCFPFSSYFSNQILLKVTEEFSFLHNIKIF